MAGRGKQSYTLVGRDGVPCASAVPGTLGGHRKGRIYGRLDCPSALRFIAKGHYVKERVFFADEATAVAAGYRPCARCLPERYAAWKEATYRDAMRRMDEAVGAAARHITVPPDQHDYDDAVVEGRPRHPGGLT